MPQKKSGRLTPSSAPELAAPSCQRSRCTAAHTPRGIASASAMAIDSTTISPLATILSASSDPMGSLKTSDVPQSPVRSPPTQRPYCARSGSFRPRLSRSPSSASGLDCVPMIIMATSPGSTLVTAKVMAEISASVSAIEARRPAR